MPIHLILGLQFGGEGKARLADLLAERADLSARFNGGEANGRTVYVGSKTYRLRLLPAGILRPQVACLLGAGMAINPVSYMDEIDALALAGVNVSPKRLVVSAEAPLVAPAHRLLEQARIERANLEDRPGGQGSAGERGVSQALVDKVTHAGLRAGDVLDTVGFFARVEAHLAETDRLLQAVYHHEPLDVRALASAYAKRALLLTPYVGDAGALARQALADGKTLLAEGASGALMDADHGVYPHVHSYSTLAGAVFSGLGIGVQPVERVIGVIKAYQYRPGPGPLPTELEGEAAKHLRGSGANPWDEYNPAHLSLRVGWLDGALLRYAVQINGVTELAVTRLDVLSGLACLKVSVKYSDPSLSMVRLAQAAPVYEELPGWQDELKNVRRWSGLPREARYYIHKIEQIAGVPVRLVSVGPERSQVIYR